MYGTSHPLPAGTASTRTVPAAVVQPVTRTDAQLSSLAAAFTALPDPCSRHGRRYDLPCLLTGLLVAALLCTCNSTLHLDAATRRCNSTRAIGPWRREQHPLLRRVFEPRQQVAPSDSLYRRALPCIAGCCRVLPAEHLEAVLAAWVQATHPTPDREAVALDGKTLRGALTATGAAPHLLAFCTPETPATQETLLHTRVGHIEQRDSRRAGGGAAAALGRAPLYRGCSSLPKPPSWPRFGRRAMRSSCSSRSTRPRWRRMWRRSSPIRARSPQRPTRWTTSADAANCATFASARTSPPI